MNDNGLFYQILKLYFPKYHNTQHSQLNNVAKKRQGAVVGLPVHEIASSTIPTLKDIYTGKSLQIPAFLKNVLYGQLGP
jgi:hypothetical protein